MKGEEVKEEYLMFDFHAAVNAIADILALENSAKSKYQAANPPHGIKYRFLRSIRCVYSDSRHEFGRAYPFLHHSTGL